MTLNELKTEAEKLGYNLVKKKPPTVRLFSCTCGRKRLSSWGNEVTKEYLVACPICGNGEKNEWKKTEREARLLWNEYIRGEE